MRYKRPSRRNPSKMTIDQIVDAYNDFAESMNEYDESEDSPHAEYTSSFAYGGADPEDIIDDAELEDETKRLLHEFLKKHGKKELFELLGALSVLDLGNIYNKNGQVFSVIIGETEHQPPDDLLEAFEALSPEEKEEVQRRVREGYVSDSKYTSGWVFLDHSYDVWRMIVSEEELYEELVDQLKKDKKSNPQSRSKVSKTMRPRVSAKISKLMHEGRPQKQAVAMALSMARKHKLGPRGGYKRNPHENRKLKEHLKLHGLSDQEIKIAEYVAMGLSNKEIANQLFLTEKKVKEIVNGIYKKINVKTRAQLIIYCLSMMDVK